MKSSKDYLKEVMGNDVNIFSPQGIDRLCKAMDDYAKQHEQERSYSETKNLLISWEQYKKDNWWVSGSVDVEKVLMERYVRIVLLKL